MLEFETMLDILLVQRGAFLYMQIILNNRINLCNIASLINSVSDFNFNRVIQEDDLANYYWALLTEVGRNVIQDKASNLIGIVPNHFQYADIFKQIISTQVYNGMYNPVTNKFHCYFELNIPSSFESENWKVLYGAIFAFCMLALDLFEESGGDQHKFKTALIGRSLILKSVEITDGWKNNKAYSEYIAKATHTLLFKTILKAVDIRDNKEKIEVKLKNTLNFYVFSLVIVGYKLTLIKDGVFDSGSNNTPRELENIEKSKKGKAECGFKLNDEQIENVSQEISARLGAEYINSTVFDQCIVSISQDKIDKLKQSAGDDGVTKNRYSLFSTPERKCLKEISIRYFNSVMERSSSEQFINYMRKCKDSFPTFVGNVSIVYENGCEIEVNKKKCIPFLIRLIILANGSRNVNADFNKDFAEIIHPKFIESFEKAMQGKLQ